MRGRMQVMQGDFQGPAYPAFCKGSLHYFRVRGGRVRSSKGNTIIKMGTSTVDCTVDFVGIA
jgi:hypothetical protein